MNGHIIFLITFRIILGVLMGILFSSNDAARHRGTGLGDIANTPLEKPDGSLLHAGGGNRCGRLLLPAFGLRDGGGSNLKLQAPPAGHQ
jgi:hypothetical protein